MDENPDTFVVVQIHQSDSYAIPWGDDRRMFYGVTGWPTAWFDGLIEHVGAYTNDEQQYNWYLESYLERIGTPTDVSVEVGGEPVGGQTYRVSARVCNDPGGQSKALLVHMVHVLDYYPASTDDRYRNCVREPSVDADSIYLPAGECRVLEHDFTFDSTSWQHQDDIKMIVWAQKWGSAPAEVYNAYSMSWPFEPLPPLYEVGDLNCDGQVDFSDINPFVLALSDPDAYAQAYPDCPFENRDINGDGEFDFNDINPFVALLSGV